MQIHPELSEQFRDFIVPFMLVSGIIGLLMVFIGHKIWTVFLALTGLSLGFLLGVILGAAVEPREPAVVFGIGFVGAVIGAALLAGIRPLGTFVVGGSISISIVAMLLEATKANRSIDQEAVLALTIMVFLIGGLVIAVCGRGGIIVASSLSGAQAVVGAGSLLIASEGDFSHAVITQFTLMELAIVCGIAILGMAVQFGTTEQVAQEQEGGLEGEAYAEKSHTKGSDVVPIIAPTRASNTGNRTVTNKIEDRLAELKRLKENGLITEDEYIEKRNELLDKI